MDTATNYDLKCPFHPELLHSGAGMIHITVLEDYDKLLTERNCKGHYWVHFTVRPPPKGNRRKTLFHNQLEADAANGLEGDARLVGE